jgi:hypothetical protein
VLDDDLQELTWTEADADTIEFDRFEGSGLEIIYCAECEGEWTEEELQPE